RQWSWLEGALQRVLKTGLRQELGKAQKTGACRTTWADGDRTARGRRVRNEPSHRQKSRRRTRTTKRLQNGVSFPIAGARKLGRLDLTAGKAHDYEPTAATAGLERDHRARRGRDGAATRTA